MPTQTDHPASVGTYNNWGALGGEGNKVSAVQGNDGDSSYIAQSFATVRQTYNMPNLPSAAGSVQFVYESARMRRTSTTGSNSIAILRFDDYTASYGPTTSWALQTASWPDHLTVADVNAAESGVEGYDSAGAENRVTEIYREVYYQLAPSGFFFILSTLLGSAITLPELARAVDHFNARELAAWKAWAKLSMTTIQPHELARAFADLKSYTHPAFSFLGV
jgi:hypothetical protein